MVTYVPGTTVAHRLDPRSKLLLQFGFAIAVFTVGDPLLLAGLAVVPAGALAAARLSPLAVLRSFRFVFLVLAFGPLIATLTWGEPWIRPAAALPSIVAIARVALVLFLSAAYVRSTPIRDSRAAIQQLIPGRVGQLLGVGIGTTVRFVPLIRRDVLAVRDAMRSRGGESRSIVERARLIAMGGLRSAFERRDRLALALQARCFAWNPTLPALSLTWLDGPVLVLGFALAISPLRFLG